MYVICLYNRSADLPPGVLALGGYGDHDSEYGLQVGRVYTVYGMTHLEGRCVEFDLDPEIPRVAPGHLFRILDGRMSRWWMFQQRLIKRFGELRDVMQSVWGYKEYVQSDEHRIALIERQPAAVALFRSYRAAMDLEFPNPTITATPKRLEGDWFQCAMCLEAWATRSTYGMLRCPACRAVQQNPRYVDPLTDGPLTA
jgi:hypothetical protein